MTFFAIGKRGEAIRMITSNATCAADQLREGEEVFSIPDDKAIGIDADGAPTYPPAPTADELLAQAWQTVTQQRDALLNTYAWTISLASPLTSDCQALWVAWTRTMHRVTVDYSSPTAVVWPALPALDYAPAQ